MQPEHREKEKESQALEQARAQIEEFKLTSPAVRLVASCYRVMQTKPWFPVISCRSCFARNH